MRMVQMRIQKFSKEGGGGGDGGEVHVGCENCTYWAHFATMEVHVRLQDFFPRGNWDRSLRDPFKYDQGFYFEGTKPSETFNVFEILQNKMKP